MEYECKYSRIVIVDNFQYTCVYLLVCGAGTVAANYNCHHFILPALLRLPILLLCLLVHVMQHSNHRRTMSLIENIMHMTAEVLPSTPAPADVRLTTGQLCKGDKITIMDTTELKVVQKHLKTVFLINVVALLIFYISIYLRPYDFQKDVPVVLFLSAMFIMNMITSNYTVGRYNQIIDIAEYSSLRKLNLKVKFGYWAPTSELFLSVTFAFIYLIFQSLQTSIKNQYIRC
jgi:hypothetical protein